MSQLLDSLRRVTAASAAPPPLPHKPAPDVILARMGYARNPSRLSRLLLVVVLALSALALIWAGLAASRRPTVESPGSAVPRAGTAPEPAQPPQVPPSAVPESSGG